MHSLGHPTQPPSREQSPRPQTGENNPPAVKPGGCLMRPASTAPTPQPQQHPSPSILGHKQQEKPPAAKPGGCVMLPASTAPSPAAPQPQNPRTQTARGSHLEFSLGHSAGTVPSPTAPQPLTLDARSHKVQAHPHSPAELLSASWHSRLVRHAADTFSHLILPKFSDPRTQAAREATRSRAWGLHAGIVGMGCLDLLSQVGLSGPPAAPGGAHPGAIKLRGVQEACTGGHLTGWVHSGQRKKKEPKSRCEIRIRRAPLQKAGPQPLGVGVEFG